MSTKMNILFIKQMQIILFFGIVGVIPIVADNLQERKLNVVIIGAHPDDADIKAGGTAYKWVLSGCNVLLVSLTNGDAGHQSIEAKELVNIRREEARKAGEIMNALYTILDNHDGQLMPTYENRLQIIKIIREFKADIVVFHRPYDYHPDHRYTGILVLDAAYMVTVPKILPEIPFLEKNPLFLYMSDMFRNPAPFKADIVINIDDVIEKKIDMLHQHKSQFYEWLPYNKGILDQVPKTETDRKTWLFETWIKDLSSAALFRESLTKLYGEEKGAKIKYCEAFQDSGYGTILTKENLSFYFPFLDPKMTSFE